MLGLLIDGVVMFAVIYLVTGETPDYVSAFLVSLGFAVVNLLCAIFLEPTVALIALLPVVGLFGAILSWMYGAPLKRAIAGSVGFLGYKTAMSFFGPQCFGRN